MRSTKAAPRSPSHRIKQTENSKNRPYKLFGAWLGEKRREKGWTQAEAAAKAGIRMNTWSRLELGESTTRSRIIKVAEVVGGIVEEALRLADLDLNNGTNEVEQDALGPHVPQMATPVDVSDVVRRAEESQEHGDYEAAERLWQQAIDVEPENQKHWRDLMRTLYLRWDPDTGEPQKIADRIIQTYRNLQMAVGAKAVDADIRMMFRSVNHMPDDASGLFVGRRADVEKVVNELVWRPVVTLCGGEGIGKTELARAVAEAVKQERQDGAYFVPLGTFVKSWQGLEDQEEQERVAQALLFTLKAARSKEQSWTDAVVAALWASDGLIVLDGCTSLRQGCAALAETLRRSCRNVRILATCRDKGGLGLGSDVERLFQVPALDVNFDTPVLPTAGLLFKKRAEWIGKAEQIKGKESLVASICQRERGLTTYIAWAASLLRSKTLEDVAAGVPLPDPKEWWKWLKPTDRSEQKLLEGLAVFPNGWTREAAQHVCADEELPDWQIASKLELLDAHGLIRREGGNDADRGWMWEPLYEAISQPVGKKDVNSLKSRLLDWCLTIAERDGDIYHKIEGLAQHYDQTEREIDNIRAALAWSLAGSPEQAVRGLRLAALTWGFWGVRGYWTEGRFWLDKTLAATASCPLSKERLGALNGAGILAIRQQDFNNAEECLEKALQCAYDGRTPDQEAAVLNSLGYLYVSWGETDPNKLEQARECYEKARDCYEDERLKNDKAARRELKWPLSGLGDVELALYRQDHSDDRLKAAANYFRESLEISEESSDKDGMTMAERHLATVSQKQDRLEDAELYLRRSLTTLNDLAETTTVMEQLAGLIKLRGTREEGEKKVPLYKKAVRLYAGAQGLRRTYGASNESEEKNRKTLAESRKEFGELLSDVVYNEQWQEGLRKSSGEIIIDALSDPVC